MSQTIEIGVMLIVYRDSKNLKENRKKSHEHIEIFGIR